MSARQMATGVLREPYPSVCDFPDVSKLFQIVQTHFETFLCSRATVEVHARILGHVEIEVAGRECAKPSKGRHEMHATLRRLVQHGGNVLCCAKEKS